MHEPSRSPLITYTVCPACGSGKALMAYEQAGRPIYFCRACDSSGATQLQAVPMRKPA